jgi:hypothetical protein
MKRIRSLVLTMNTNGGEQEVARSDMQLKFIGFLIAVSLSILGWGFNNWSQAVETGMQEVMDKLNRIESRNEDRDDRIYEMGRDIYVLRERQNIIKEQVDKHALSGHPVRP